MTQRDVILAEVIRGWFIGGGAADERMAACIWNAVEAIEAEGQKRETARVDALNARAQVAVGTAVYYDIATDRMVPSKAAEDAG